MTMESPSNQAGGAGVPSFRRTTHTSAEASVA